jgi:predicted outer membrane repeat protein
VTIQNGRSETGGGLKIANSATSERVQLSDVVVKDSLAENLGGGIHVVSASPKFDNVVVQNCSGGNDRTGNANRGGGIYIETNSSVIANDLTVKGCSLDVSGKGGGLNVDESSSGVFTNAVIENNSAFFAAGIFIGNNCKPKFINAKVSGNSASYGSGIGIFNGGDAEFVDGTISKNTPTANAESYGGGLLVYSGAKGTFTGVTFTENEADYGAGVMAWPQAILLTFDSCMFTKNVAKVNGGAINAKTASTIVTSAQTTLAGNVAQNLGGAIHAEPSASVTLSSETTVYKNTAKNGGGVSCVGADITINSASKFVENVASSYGGGVYLESSCKTTVTAAVFSGNTAGGSNETVCPRVRGAGGGAFAVVGVYDVSSVSQGATNLEISQNTVMTKNAAIDGGAIFVLSSSDAATTSSTSGSTPSVSLYSEGAIVTVREGATLLENTAFGCHGPGEKRGAGGGIYASVGIVTAKDAIFSKNVAATHGGGIRAVDNVASLKLDATTMAENVASDGFGGAIASSAIAFRVENGSVMSKNEATNGGAISIAPPSEESGADSALDFELASLTLDSNVASKVGGGVYFDANFAKASITPTTMNTLSQLIFRSNVAESGPSVYWTRASSPNVEFTCESCSNLPTFHPEDYATEALKVQAPAHVLAELSKGVGSGEVAKSFSVELVDYYGHVAVSEPASSTCTISTASHELDDIAITDYAGDLGRLEFLKNHSPLVVSGELSENSQKGVSTFDKVTFRGELGDVYRVSFLCKRENDVQIGDELILNAQILNCLPGYQPNWMNLENGEKSARICSYCEDRTFNLDGIQCKPCPEGGDCRGGSDISSLEGWWRSNDLSEYIFQCPMGAEACKATNSTGNVACEDAYEGPVCALCKEGFRKLGGKCLKCQSKPITDAIPVIGILALIGFIIYIFKKPLQEAAGTVLATCVIYVFQTLGLLYSYDVEWPSPMKRTLGILDVTNLNLDALAPGCSNASNTFYVSYIGALTVPPIILMLTFVAFNTAGVIRKMNRNTFLGLNINDEILIEFQGKCKRNCVWMLVLTYAGVTKTVLQLFNSRTLDVGTFLRVDYKIEAEGATFNAYRSSAYLAMIIYPFGLPLFLAWKLLKRRPTGKLSESDSLRSTYGFMYKSNRPGCEGWELVLLATKFFLAAIPVFATERNLRGDPNSGYDVSSEFASACQIAMAQMLCGVAFCLALYVKPYAQPLHNRQFSLAIGTVISWLAVTTAVFANPQAFTNTESSGVGAGLVIFSLVTLAYAISASAKAGEKPFAREKKDPDEPSFWKSQSMFLKSFKRIDVQTTQKGTSTTEDNDEKASSLKPLAAEAA